MVKICVCIGSACHLKGSYNVINALQELIENNNLGNQVGIEAVFCLNHCTQAVSVKVNDGDVQSVSAQTVKDFFSNKVLPLVQA
ncbi:MAG: (2Fe-2S) ferredoxin domain-containing protein [Bacillota bacterium]